MEMLKAGVHFGHSSSKRHPKMQPYIYTSRSGINIIDLNQTAEKLEEALANIQKLSSEGKTILFVGTKKQAQKIVKKYAIQCEMPYIINRWIGGSFTNFSIFRNNIKKYIDIKQKFAKGAFDKYTKKERLTFKKEMDRLDGMVGGLVSLEKLPDVVFVVDTKKDKIAVEEAGKMKIPVMAICDTNANPKNIKWVIPGNDDAVKSLDMIAGLVSEAIKEGKESRLKTASIEKKEEKAPLKK